MDRKATIDDGTDMGKREQDYGIVLRIRIGLSEGPPKGELQLQA